MACCDMQVKPSEAFAPTEPADAGVWLFCSGLFDITVFQVIVMFCTRF